MWRYFSMKHHAKMPKNHRWVNNNRYNISHLFLRFFTRKTFHKAFKHVESDIWDQFYIKNHANIPIDQTEMHKDMLMFGQKIKWKYELNMSLYIGFISLMVNFNEDTIIFYEGSQKKFTMQPIKQSKKLDDRLKTSYDKHYYIFSLHNCSTTQMWFFLLKVRM